VNQLKNQARREEQRENWSRAIELYTHALDASRMEGEAFADLSLYNRIGDIYLRIGQKNTAVRYYEQAIERYAEQDLHTSAIALCNKVLRIHPERSTIFLQMGRLHLATSLIADARAHYHKYAESMRERGTDEAALEALEELIDETGDAQTLDLWLSWLVELSESDVVLGRMDRIRNRLISHGIDPDQVLERVGGSETAAREDGLPIELEPDPLAGAFLSMPELDDGGGRSRKDVAAVQEPPSAAAEVEIPEPMPIEFGSSQWDDEAEELLSELNGPVEATWEAYGAEDGAVSTPQDVESLSALDPEPDLDAAEGAASAWSAEYDWIPPSLDLDLEAEEGPEPAPGMACRLEPGEGDAASTPRETALEPSSRVGESSESNAGVAGVGPASPITPVDNLELEEGDPWIAPHASAFDAEPSLPDDELPEPADEESVEPDADPPVFVDSSTSLAEAAVEAVIEVSDLEPAVETRVFVETSEATPVGPRGPSGNSFPLLTAEDDEDARSRDDAWVEEARSAVAEIAVAPAPSPDPEPELKTVHEPDVPVAIAPRDEITGPWAAESRLVVEDDPEDAFQDWVRSASTGVLRRALTELENRDETDKALLVIRHLSEQESSGVEYRTKLVDHLEKLGRMEPAAEACLTLGTALERGGHPDEARTAYGRVLRIEPGNEAARSALRRLESVERSGKIPPADENPEGFEDRPIPYMPDHVVSTEASPLLAPMPQVTAANGNGGGVESRPYSGVAGGADAATDLEQLLSDFRAELHQHPGQPGSNSHTELGASLKEMGRLDDAIRELQAAVREPSPPPLAFELLGEAFLEKGQGRIAARLLEKAVGSLGRSDREVLGVLYQLGLAYESLTETTSALTCYERIFSIDIDYRDIQARIVSCSA